MKRIFLTFILAAMCVASYAQRLPSDTITINKVQVLDSTIVNDTKLLIVSDRLYSKNGLIDVLVQQASKEKAETGKIEKHVATQTFIDNINADYDKYLKKFIVVDTLWVDSIKVRTDISAIETWMVSVLNDPQIKNATSLGVWEEKDKELQRLKKFKKQIKK